MGNYNKSIITPAEFQALQSWKVPYTGFVKGVGYTYPEYFSLEIPRDPSIMNSGWGDWFSFPLRKQVWDRSPEAIFRSMNYTPEDIFAHIRKDNNDGTTTFTVQEESITVSSNPNKYNIKIQINDNETNYCIKIAIQNLETNQCLFKTIGNDNSIPIPAHQQENSGLPSFLDRGVDIANDINTGFGFFSGVYTTSLNSTVNRIHPFRPVYYADNVIYRPALPGYRLGKIPGGFIEKSFKFMGRLGNISGVASIGFTSYRYSTGQISTARLILDQTFNVIGFLYLPGFIISTTYTAVDEFYPNGWQGLWDDICREQYNMYMNQVSDKGVMMAPWLMGK